MKGSEKGQQTMHEDFSWAKNFVRGERNAWNVVMWLNGNGNPALGLTFTHLFRLTAAKFPHRKIDKQIEPEIFLPD